METAEDGILDLNKAAEDLGVRSPPLDPPVAKRRRHRFLTVRASLDRCKSVGYTTSRMSWRASGSSRRRARTTSTGRASRERAPPASHPAPMTPPRPLSRCVYLHAPRGCRLCTCSPPSPFPSPPRGASAPDAGAPPRNPAPPRLRRSSLTAVPPYPPSLCQSEIAALREDEAQLDEKIAEMREKLVAIYENPESAQHLYVAEDDVKARRPPPPHASPGIHRASPPLPAAPALCRRRRSRRALDAPSPRRRSPSPTRTRSSRSRRPGGRPSKCPTLTRGWTGSAGATRSSSSPRLGPSRCARGWGGVGRGSGAGRGPGGVAGWAGRGLRCSRRRVLRAALTALLFPSHPVMQRPRRRRSSSSCRRSRGRPGRAPGA